MAKLSLYVKIIDTKTGHIDYEGECHSWVRNFLATLWAAFQYDTITPVLYDIFNVPRTFSACPDTDYVFLCMVNGHYYPDYQIGIVLGSGTAVEVGTDYSLATWVPHGTQNGRLSYGTMGFVEAYTTGTTIYFDMSRTFTNNSGSSIDVKEIGLYVEETRIFCIARDLLASTVAIADGATKTVTYRVSMNNAG